MIYFSADLHLDHGNIIKYCSRPFDSVAAMDNIILSNFKVMKPGDTLYLLGDLSFNEKVASKFFDMFSEINMVFIKGNHDSRKLQKITRERNIPLYALMDIKIDAQSVTLRVWNKSHYNAWQLHGHSHGTLPPQGKQYDVGVDANDFAPVSWDKIKEIMKHSPNNLNYIGE
jgi:calcineurin-like phosphoesterase family protein